MDARPFAMLISMLSAFGGSSIDVESVRAILTAPEMRTDADVAKAWRRLHSMTTGKRYRTAVFGPGDED